MSAKYEVSREFHSDSRQKSRELPLVIIENQHISFFICQCPRQCCWRHMSDILLPADNGIRI